MAVALALAAPAPVVVAVAAGHPTFVRAGTLWGTGSWWPLAVAVVVVAAVPAVWEEMAATVVVRPA